MAKRLVTAVFLAALMILLSTNSLLVDRGTQTEVEILSDEIRLESISSNSPGQVLGHIDTHDTLSIGRQFACALTENSSVVCWGRTDYGQTGIGTSGSQAYHNMTYVDALNGMGIVEVSAHLDHACGLTSQGAVYCWGSNQNGQIGNGQVGGNVLVPTQALLPQGVVAKSLSQGPSAHTCIISTDGDLYCWGNNNRGQVGNGQICFDWNGAVSYTNPCYNGQSGILTPELIAMPSGVAVTSVSVGGEHTCATGTDGGVYCWGSDMNCRVTGGDTVSADPITEASGCGYWWLSNTPRKLAMSNPEVTIQDVGNLSFVQAVNGWVFSCAMTDTGSGICWGANTESQQGIGNNSNEPFAVVPTMIQGPPGESMTSMSATTAQACALYDQTGAHCWGDNWAGNTGDYNGSNDVTCNYQFGAGGGGNINCQDRSAPHQVHTGGNYMAVVMGAANACGLDSSNDIHCWGAYAWNNVNQSYHQIWWGTRVPELMQLPGTAKIALDDLDSDGDGLNSPFDLWPEGCPSGWYQDAPNSCAEAPAGYYAEEGLPWNLVICPSGTFQPNGGQPSCIDSTPGYHVPDEGAYSQTICPAGSYQPNSGSSNCILADPGHMVETPGKTFQSPCTVGRYSSMPGATSCVKASPGFYVDSASATEQTPCPPGSYSSTEGSVSCSSTSPGQYTSANASTEPELCAQGSYQPNAGSSSCILAPGGHYVSSVGATSFQPCLSGEYQPLEGSTDCEVTLPGYYTSGAGSLEAVACQPGSYQPNSRADMCVFAIPGSYVGHEAAVEYTICSVGTFQPNQGSSECMVVEAGHYATGEGAQNQIACPVTTYQPMTGQTSCIDVEAGHYTNQMGSSEQVPCEPGTYQPMVKTTSCRDSPAGHFVPGSAATEFVACAVGTYQPISASSSCIEADEGHFVDSTSQLSQKPCEKGSYQPSQGSSECLSADEGHFVDAIAATEQTPCPPGTYQPLQGQFSCTFTSMNFFTSESGSVDQTPCPPGQHQPLTSQTECVEKPDEGGLLPGLGLNAALLAMVAAAIGIRSKRED